MAFPTGLSNAIDGTTEIVAAHLNNLETKVGIDSSAVVTSLDYLLKNTSSIDPGHKHSKLWASDGSPEAVSVDATGNVGIGTSSPGYKLEVNGNVKIGTYLGVGMVPSTMSPIIIKADSTSKVGFSVQEDSSTKNLELGIVGGEGFIQAWDRDNSVSFPYYFGGTTIGFVTGGVIPSTNMHVFIDSTGNVGIGTISPSALLDINSDTLRLRTSKTPSSAGATGNAGDICWDSSYVYVCVATNTWKRTAISTW